MKNFDDVIINKTESIRRCVERAREEYLADRDNFLENFSRQDAAMMNIQRGCEQAIDLANHVVRLLRIGSPANASDSFDMLVKAKVINRDLADRMDDMIGFRNTVVHEYQEINFNIVVAVLEKDADDLLKFGESIRKQHDKLKMLSKVSDVETDDEEKAEEQLINLIEKFYDFYKEKKRTCSNKINDWRIYQIENAVSAISGKGAPKMLRLCKTCLRLFFEDESVIPDSLKGDSKKREEVMNHDILVLKNRVKSK